MFQNYLTTAIRNLIKHKLYAFINVGGLAIGLAACLLILLFVRDELSYDTWLPNAERIATVEITFAPPGREPFSFARTPGPAAAAMAEDFSSDIDQATRVYTNGEAIRAGEQKFNDGIMYVDANFFEIFDLPLISGVRELAVTNNSSILLTEEMAKKYFGDEPALGETLTVNNEVDYTVVGVLKDLPDNTHLDVHMIALFDPVRYADQPWVAEHWFSANMYAYVLFNSADGMAQAEAGLPAFLDRRVAIDFPGVPSDAKASNFISLHFMPLLDIHLKGRIPGYPKPGGDFAAVITFSAVAGLILLIACINFMNLATARSMQRAREVSMRKVLGATRQQLVGQFLGETVLTAIAGMLFALALAELVIGPYGDFLGKTLEFNLMSDPLLLLTMIGLVIIVGLFGGSYPAMYLSSFRPAHILKANQSTADGSTRLRNALVVFQFAISVGLIASTAIVYGQTIYARGMDPGFERDNKLIVSGHTDEVRQTLRDRVIALPGVRAASLASDTIPQQSNNNSMIFPTATPGDDGVLIENVRVDTEFFSVFGIEPVAGRVFSEDFQSDYSILPEDETQHATQSIVVNQTFLGKFGFASPDDAIGKTVWDSINQEGRMARTTIVGVVPDLHTRSARFEITPTLYYLRKTDDPFMGGALAIDVAPGRMSETLEAINEIWHEIVPDRTISTSFVDEDIAALYDAEEQRATMFAGFALFAVLVASLGLYGLASFAAEKRTKEIGLRKVMGASVIDIVRLLVWQFSKPVIIANIIAWPTAWYFMAQWLSNFEYRIDLTNPAVLLLTFGGAGAVALFIAWATVAGHATRVARSNPVNALRYE